jgi:hypothetical protein
MHKRHDDGTFHIAGHKFEHIRGSRRQVWNRTAFKTDGGLTRADIIKNKWGNLVSRRKHLSAKKQKRLQKAGWFPRKDGQFGAVQKTRKR